MFDEQAAVALQQVHGEEVGATGHPDAAVIRHGGRVPEASRDTVAADPPSMSEKSDPRKPHAGGPGPTLRNPSPPYAPRYPIQRGFKPALRVIA